MKLAIFLTIMIIAGCSAGTKHAQITNYQAPGNLESKHPLGCVPLSEMTSEYTPADIYPGVAACIKAGKYNKAVQLFALASAFGYFDRLRVIDKSAHQAVRVLQITNLRNLPMKQKKTFMKTMKSVGATNSESLKTMCSTIKDIGPPSYFPTYMVQHGMSAFTGLNGTGVDPNFNVKKSWKEALSVYLHCP